MAPLTLQLAPAGASPRVIVVTTDTECSVLQPSQTLFNICSLAVNADPAVIGGAAFGRLNSEPTPSFDALVWRARANRDAAVCAAGGLLDATLVACQKQAVDPGYSLSDSGVTVGVPIAP